MSILENKQKISQIEAPSIQRINLNHKKQSMLKMRIKQVFQTRKAQTIGITRLCWCERHCIFSIQLNPPNNKLENKVEVFFFLILNYGVHKNIMGIVCQI